MSVRSSHGWRVLLEKPPLDAAVRASIAQRVVGWLLGPLWIVAIGIAGAGAATAARVEGIEPRRLIPLAFMLPALCVVTHLRRRKRWMLAAAVLSVSMFVSITAVVLINSVHAPAYQGGFVLFALVLPLFGHRWAIASAVGLLAAGALWVIMNRLGIALPVTHPPAETRLVLYLGNMILTLIMLGGMHRLLADALHDARRKQAEAEDARAAEAVSELAVRAVFDQASVGVILLTQTGAISRINRHAAEWLGATASQLLGHALDQTQRWSDVQRRLLVGAVARAAQGQHARHELTLNGPLGAQTVYQVSLSPFYAPSGALGHVMVEIVDVTDLVRTRALLAKAHRLEALGKLSGGVAHDINNMLAAIMSACDLAAGDAAAVSTSRAIIQQSVLRASSLTKQLLAFGRQDRFETVAIDVNQLVLEMGRLFERTLRKNVLVQLAPCELPAYMLGDVAALEHALLNLALNAQDAMPDGGTLTITTAVVELDAAARACLPRELPAGPVVMIRVQDTGTGMTQAVREQLFDPFFTTKSRGQGSGLGLAAVHGTVSNHLGAVIVESEQGAGSRFDLYFPWHAQPPRAARAPEPASTPRLNARVLLADDEPLVRQTLAAMLELDGCQVQAFDSGDALIAALSIGPAPDVIVSDLMMPGLCGIQLVRTLQATRHGCPLLLITGFTGDDVSRALSGDSACLLLRKPFSQSELYAALTQLLQARSAAPTLSQSA